MIANPEPQAPRVAGFRWKLLLAVMLLVSVVTLVALYVAQRSLAENFADDLQRAFQRELAALDHAQEVRRAALFERCRTLVRRPRIHAALEDDALDRLYSSAEDELRDVMVPRPDPAAEAGSAGLRAQFYRFLDAKGAVIPHRNPRNIGTLSPTAEQRLALPAVPDRPHLGYLPQPAAAPTGLPLAEVITMPIFSTESGEPIAALALGFKPFESTPEGERPTMESGIWVEGGLHGGNFSAADRARLVEQLRRGTRPEPTAVALSTGPHLLMTKRLNPDSHYAPADEVCVYPLTGLIERQRTLRWQVLGAGGLLLLVGLVGSHLLASRFSAPVEKLAVDSEENRVQRRRVEAALETTSAELQRSARFSADASHQLKTPVTVLRAGLEELLARPNLTEAECHEISALIHQTYRLSSLIEDLLLLSRMDAGRLKLEFTPVHLTQLIEALIDDLSALPDEIEVTVETDFPAGLYVAGEKRYTAIILQNLLENARKYNRPGGTIRVVARVDGECVRLSIANQGSPIAPAAQAHIFERFHRGAMGENVPGYGLGLNIARELARLHRGELRLVRSDAAWTEFELTLQLAQVPAAA